MGSIYSCTFSLKQSIVIGPFMSHMAVSMTFFTDHCTQDFFFNHFMIGLFDSDQ